MRRLLILLLTCLILSGCQSMATQLGGSLTPPPGQGYAVVSLTARSFEPDSSHVEARFVGLDGGPGGRISASLLTDTVFGEEGMSPAAGKLALLTLPPGRYRFVEAIGYYPDTGFLRGVRIARLPMRHDFAVTAGQASYLGEIRLDLSNLPDVEVRDAQRRDFGHIRRVWHVDDLSPLQVELLAPAR